MNDFEQTVLADLATLKAQMKLLVGNGQPGRIQQLEAKVDEHDRAFQRAQGIGALLGFLITLIHVGIDYLKIRH